MAKNTGKIDRVECLEKLEKDINKQIEKIKDITLLENEVFSMMTINNIINNLTIAKDNAAFLGIMFKTDLMTDENNKEDRTSIQ